MTIINENSGNNNFAPPAKMSSIDVDVIAKAMAESPLCCSSPQHASSSSGPLPSLEKLSPSSSFTCETTSIATSAESDLHSRLVVPTGGWVDFFIAEESTEEEEDRELLRDVTTKIRDFDSISATDEDGLRFVPLLEGRGGTDKDPKTGHRRDSIAIANAIVDEGDGSKSAVFQYLEDGGGKDASAARTNEALRRHLLRCASGLVVRVNPGTLSAACQAKLDMMLTELSAAGITLMSSPEVQRKMGAKDALVKIKHLRCGLPDTSVYYDAQSFIDGFRKSIAFRPRVVKQNRGSQGEGIWICKLKDESAYCQSFGDVIADLDTELVLMEANDNHVEYHTVGEFLEFCLNGRTEKSGTWSSTGVGRYLEGGLEAGAMLVDQRFLPRIVEGEVRCAMVGPTLVGIVHKKPRDGGLSATLQSGAIYTKYSPDHPMFAGLVENFRADLPEIMSSFGMGDQPLPLLWTADYIFGDVDEETGWDTFYVGEFNCACVGITQQMELAGLVGKTVNDTCFPESSEEEVVVNER